MLSWGPAKWWDAGKSCHWEIPFISKCPCPRRQKLKRPLYCDLQCQTTNNTEHTNTNNLTQINTQPASVRFYLQPLQRWDQLLLMHGNFFDHCLVKRIGPLGIAPPPPIICSYLPLFTQDQWSRAMQNNHHALVGGGGSLTRAYILSFHFVDSSKIFFCIKIWVAPSKV